MSIVTPAQALELLKNGDIVAVPTETVYGLAGRIDRDESLNKIFSTKARPFFDPLIVHVHSVAQARSLCAGWPSIFDSLAKKFWPGPLTLIAAKAPEVSPLITSGLETVAIRCPNHPIALQLLREFKTPFAAPSANRFGRTSPTTAAHVESEFGGTVAVIDGGSSAIGLESTVLSAVLQGDKWKLKIHRPGAVTKSQIAEVLEQDGFKFTITREESSASPGNLKAHYQPESPVFILNKGEWNADARAKAERKLGRKLDSAIELILPPTPEQAARMLYSELRRLSQGKTSAIYIKRTPTHTGENWEAIWDRLQRASTTTI